jgi:endogenous inhibitor of DNA gyrase (YacG/DUF329 family)
MTNIGGLTFKNIKIREDYEKNKSSCLKCGEFIPYEKRKNKFCSHSCAAAITNLGRIVDDEHKDKVRKSILEWRKENPDKVEKSQHINLTCQHCSSIFSVPPSGDKRKFCSRKCADIGHNHENSGGYRKGSGRGKKGWYKGYWCDSSWELAWVIYSLDNGLKFTRNTQGFEYMFNETAHIYYPDYLMEDGTYIEIKGYTTAQWEAKKNSFNGKIKIFDKVEMIPILKYVKEKYGFDFIKLYEGNPHNQKTKVCGICGEPCKSMFCSRKCSGKAAKKRNLVIDFY